jgi:hypothetical protein
MLTTNSPPIAGCKAPLVSQETVGHLQCTDCGSGFFGQPLISPLTCPSCGRGVLALVEVLPLDDPWFHLLPRVEV